MNREEWLRIAAMTAVVVMEAYAIQPWKFPVLAWFWDVVARWCGHAANRLGWISVNARANYFTAVSNGT